MRARLGLLAGALAALIGMTSTAGAAAPDRPNVIKPVERFSDSQGPTRYLKSKGYRTKGGVSRSASERDRMGGRAFPSFTFSAQINGITYPFTMVGNPPQSGVPATLRSVIIPLRMNFGFFGANQDVFATFDPADAVQNIVNSPLFVPTHFPNGYGQFGDQMQRAAFWNRMDRGHNWHVRMAQPVVLPTLDIEVTPETGDLSALDDTHFLGNVLIDFMDAEILTILQLLKLPADVLPVFVTSGSIAEALGYHSATLGPDGSGGTQPRTYIYTSWLDPALVDPLFADVSTFNHELMEWMNDPYINNLVPAWSYPPASDPRASCSGNPLLEVGDPQGNGPTFDDFPTVPVALNGTIYHLQQLVLWQWFVDEVPSSAFGGWYTFPQPASLTRPAVFCN